MKFSKEIIQKMLVRKMYVQKHDEILFTYVVYVFIQAFYFLERVFKFFSTIDYDT